MKIAENLQPRNSEESGISKFQRDYSQVVEKYFPSALRNSPIPVKVVDVACGFALGAKAIASFIGEQIDYTGIDNRTAQGAAGFNHSLPGKSQFIEGDVRDRSILGNDNDLVILRNPQVFGDGMNGGRFMVPDWQKIIHNSFDSLKPNGDLVVTTLELEEAQAVLELIPSGSYKTKQPLEQISPKLDPNFTLVENYIFVLQKT